MLSYGAVRKCHRALRLQPARAGRVQARLVAGRAREVRQTRNGLLSKWTVRYDLRADGKVANGAGARLTAADEEEAPHAGSIALVFPHAKRLPKAVTEYLDWCCAHLLPKGYESGSVHESYYAYVGWHALSATAGSMCMVLAMQAILFGAGLGSGAIPVGMALSWVLKDGIGQLGGVAFASLVNRNFDADPKRWRFIAGVLLDVSSMLEAAIPFAPKFFLPLAATANCFKNISFLAASATRASFHIAFSLKGNLADITAKAGSQTTVFSTIGTGLGAVLSYFLNGSHVGILVSLLVLSAMHLTTLARCIATVPLPSFNLQRFEIVVKHFFSTGEVLNPVQVCDAEVCVGERGSYLLNGHLSAVKVGSPFHVFAGADGDASAAAAELVAQKYCVRMVDGEAHVAFAADADEKQLLRALFEAFSLAVGYQGPASFEAFFAAVGLGGWDVRHIYVEDSPSRISVVPA
ncbi:Protein root UVB sensitive 3 [Diplonema papillatum]|nr:Protein root UVB sensitive 3 [Diplonema papillatum]|eukprot:gene17165-26341_t